MKIYIAGSVTNGGTLTPEQIRKRCDQFDSKELDLLHYGDEPINPTRIDRLRPYEVEQTPDAMAAAMRLCLQALLDCEAIYMLRGWEVSKFAQIELTVARTVAMTVIYQPGADHAKP